MSEVAAYRALLRRGGAAVAAGAALVAACYFFVDRPVAWFVHDRHVGNPYLKDLTLPPPVLQAAAPAVIALLVVRRAFAPWARWEAALLAAAVGVILADQFRQSLAFVFGRYWPDTWIENNPSLIGGGAYGFHPFHHGSWYMSFPSGHTARTAAVAGVIAVAWPRWAWAGVALVGVEAVALVGMNYHFVGDTVGGAVVGGVVGAYTAVGCGCQPLTRQTAP